jgi:tRNA (pseudouridine54-N1)-methyltransferase
MRRAFVVIGQTARASADFSLEDLPSTSGRLDVLVRCLRAALLVSHGVRQDAVVYLVLLGGPRAPRCVRVDGASARFLRPDERSLATIVRKALAADAQGAGFVGVRPGIAVAEGALDVVLADLGEASFHVLEEGARDVRDASFGPSTQVFFIGDHRGFDAAIRACLVTVGAQPIGVGPVSLHADDAVAVLSNELDRRHTRGPNA